MNDDLPLSPSNRPPSDDILTAHVEVTAEPESRRSSSEKGDLHRERIRIQTKKRLEMIGSLLRNIDIMIYCELSALYYMDCSAFRFLIRAVVQFLYLTPKPPFFPETPRNRPYMVAILATNTICALLHLIFARPEAGEAMRGYLHGGLMIDFVGQKGPVSKIWLLTLDLLTLTMQLFMLATHIEHRSIKDESKPAPCLAAAPTSNEAATSSQNHDSEERGILRSEPFSTEDIELQTLTSRPRDDLARSYIEGVEHEETEGMSTELAALRTDDHRDHPLDTFHSGEMVLVDLYLLDSIHKQYRAFAGYVTVSSVEPTSILTRHFLRGRRNREQRLGNSDLEQS